MDGHKAELARTTTDTLTRIPPKSLTPNTAETPGETSNRDLPWSWVAILAVAWIGGWSITTAVSPTADVDPAAVQTMAESFVSFIGELFLISIIVALAGLSTRLRQAPMMSMGAAVLGMAAVFLCGAMGHAPLTAGFYMVQVAFVTSMAALSWAGIRAAR